MKTNKGYMQDETASRIEVMAAYIEGATIESTPIPVPGDSTTNIDWQPEEMPTWDWQHRHYRIKQELSPETIIVSYNDHICVELEKDNIKYNSLVLMADYIDRLFNTIADLRKDNEDLRTEIDRLRKDVDAIPKTPLVPYIPYSPYVGDVPQPYVFPQVWYSTSTGSPKETDAYTAERRK